MGMFSKKKATYTIWKIFAYNPWAVVIIAIIIVICCYILSRWSPITLRRKGKPRKVLGRKKSVKSIRNRIDAGDGVYEELEEVFPVRRHRRTKEEIYDDMFKTHRNRNSVSSKASLRTKSKNRRKLEYDSD